MLVMLILLAILGGIASREDRYRALLMVAGALAITLAMERGYYWNLFGRGTGWWTANRTTALVLFAVILIGPSIPKLLRR